MHHRKARESFAGGAARFRQGFARGRARFQQAPHHLFGKIPANPTGHFGKIPARLVCHTYKRGKGTQRHSRMRVVKRETPRRLAHLRRTNSETGGRNSQTHRSPATFLKSAKQTLEIYANGRRARTARLPSLTFTERYSLRPRRLVRFHQLARYVSRSRLVAVKLDKVAARAARERAQVFGVADNLGIRHAHHDNRFPLVG